MKKNIYSFLIAFLVLNTILVQAQSISYTYEKDDPHDIKNFSFAIDPFFIDVNGHNSYAFGWGLRAEHMIGKRLLANFDMRTGFGTNLYKKSNDNTRNYFNMEGGLGLIFFNKTRTRNVPIILSQTTSGNTRTTVSIKGGVPAKCWLIVALRGGFQQYTNTLDYKNFVDTLLTVGGMPYKTAKDSYIFKDSSGTNVKQMDQVGGIAMTSLYGGLQFRTIRNLIIDVSGYGTRSNIRYSDFYIDVLFAPVIAIRDFKNTDGKAYDVKYDKMSHLGWRFGWFWRKPKDQGFSAKLEMGSRPGFKAPSNVNVPVNVKNLYCTLTFGLYIPLKIKPVYDGN